MKKVIFIFLSILITISARAVNFDFSAVTSSGQILYYSIVSENDHQVKVTYPNYNNYSNYYYGYDEPSGTLVIPPSVSSDGVSYSVIAIDANSFRNCDELTSVTIPSSVTSIGGGAFSACNGLTRTYYSGNIAQWCGINFLDYASNPIYFTQNLYINNVEVTNLVVPDGVTEIKSFAFRNCSGLTSVTIPNTVTTIGNSAFGGCTGLSSITIPSSVATIGISAFVNCNGITTVNYNATNCTTMGSSSSSNPVFSGCNSLTTLNIGENVTTIPAYAFYGCSRLQSITIPGSVTTIGNCAFGNCTGITTVNYNAINCTTMGSINYPVFSGCNSLTTLNIGENVTTIPAYAFYGCSRLQSITIPSSITSIGSNAFSGCSGLTYVNFPNVTAMANWCGVSLGNNTANPIYYAHNIAINGIIMTNLVIPNSVTTIGKNCFYGCSGLASVVIPSSVDSIGIDAFYGCSGLTSVGFPDMEALSNWCRVSLGNYNSNPMFYSHNISIAETIITNLLIPNDVEIVKKNTFRGCSSLSSISLPSSLTTIEDSAFFGCFGLSSVVIPNAVTSVGNAAFASCTGLTTVTLGSAVTSMHYQSFTGCTGLDTVYSFANWPPAIIGGTSTRFCNCGHLVGKLIVPCGRASFYSSWSSYFSGIECVNVFSLNAQANNANWGTVAGVGNYPQGTSVQLIASPNYGYHFVQWNDSITSITRTVQLVSDTTFIAYFSPNQYTITVSSGNPSLGTVTGGGTYDYGSAITLVATAQEHYHLDHWSDGNTDNPRTLTVSSDSNLIAYFALDQFALAVNTNNPEWGTVTGGGTYGYGSVVTITASPVDNHRHFIGWNDDNTNATRTITLVSDTSFTAYFDCDQYTVTVTSAEPTMGFVTGDGTYDYGSTATIVAHPNSGFQFLYWSDGSTESTRYLTVTQDMELVAYFGQKQGVDDVENDNLILLYPNPACEQVTLQLQSLSAITHLTVTDQLGREVLHRQLQGENYTFPVSGWLSGTYFVKITSPDGNITVQKLMVR